MEVGMSIAGSGNGERETHQLVAGEGSNHLTSDLLAYNEQAKRNNVHIIKVPYLFLQIHAGFEFVQANAFADNNLIRRGCTGAQRPSSDNLARCQSSSITSRGASSRDVPRSCSFCSSQPNRLRNFRLVRRSADSGSTDSLRARFTMTKKRSPISSSIRACSSTGILAFESGLRESEGSCSSCSRNSPVSSVSFSKRPLISGQSKPTWAALELILWASIRAGILDETASSSPAAESSGVPLPAARSFLSSFLMAS